MTEWRIQATDRDSNPLGKSYDVPSERRARIVAADMLANDPDVFGVQITVMRDGK